MSSSSDTTARPAPGRPFGAYRPSPGVYDEMVSEPGVPRPHWREFTASVERLEPEELASRWENGRRVIREHGVTYNVYGDPRGTDRPWELDMIPLIIPTREWQEIEAGLRQRTELFNLILADLYGPQRLLRDGVLPPSLVFANPAYLRPCHGIQPPRNIHLHLHGVDLARSSDGRWWVLADRTQAPSGAGYALENRIVLSRILPDEFRDCRVQRLATFFAMQRETLRALAPRNVDHPNVVLLTPGPHNETYFEHAYLSRYLGFTLVEGADLTVRDRRVFIKTLEGLQQVDVIMRRLDDTFCDPLELRDDSFLGVPGLVEAARSGNVTLANALGSGLVESPAFMAFLPGLCRRLLGEELKLPSVATWWCGQGREHRYVVDHLDEIVVKPAFGSVSRMPIFGDRLAVRERAELVAAIQSHPHEFVGQEQVFLSRAPVWVSGHLEPRSVVMRAYVAAAGGSYGVLPGGLTRVSSAGEDPVVSMQSGGGSKDTWVLADGPVAPVTLLNPMGVPVQSERAATELPSRVADDLYWLGRYAERLEALLRLVRCVIIRMTGESGGDGSPELAALARMMVKLELLPERFKGRFPLRDLEQQILLLAYHSQRPGSVRELVGRIRQIASTVRDRFSSDTWRILNQLQLDSRSRPGRLPFANALGMLNTLIVDLSAFSGMEMENMTRGHGWRFLDLGRRLERGINLGSLVEAAISEEDPVEPALEPLLEIADSVMTYRRQYFTRATLPGVLQLLLRAADNPRSLAFQLLALRDHARDLPRDVTGARVEDERRIIEDLTRKLEEADLLDLAARRESGNPAGLSLWLEGFSSGLAAVSDTLTRHYFSHIISRVS